VSFVLLAAAALTAQPPVGLASLRIEHAAARVVIVPEARGALSVAIRQGRGLPPLTQRRDGPALVIDGGLADAGRRGRFDLLDRSRCRAKPADLPVVTVRAPLNARIAVSGAIFGEVRASDSLELTADGCGVWRVGPVRLRLTIRTSGSPTVEVASVNGELGVQLKGSGDVIIGGGHAPVATVVIDGSGDIEDRGSIGRLQARGT
jgi:hypothetical protein